VLNSASAPKVSGNPPLFGEIFVTGELQRCSAGGMYSIVAEFNPPFWIVSLLSASCIFTEKSQSVDYEYKAGQIFGKMLSNSFEISSSWKL
jgi:hypothetical protein